MQFAVPQFTEVEDKLIGPLTLKQFLVILASGAVIMFFYSIFGINIFFFIFAIPLGILGLALAFGKFNGRPLFGYIGAFIAYLSRPQVRVFKREEVTVSMTFKTEKKAEPIVVDKTIEEPNQSRLKKLAYLLDQKTAEEKELLDRKI
jgi:hypothetical protein